MSEEIIGTKNPKIIEFLKNRPNYFTTILICPKCGKENKLSNYEFIGNINVNYRDKTFSSINIKCYNCKRDFELGVSENYFTTNFIDELLELNNKTSLDILNAFEQMNSPENFAIKIYDKIIKSYINKDIPGNLIYDEGDEKIIKELNTISEQTKLFLIEIALISLLANLKDLFHND